jgi:ligand-binding SRPBCC domain-containing protein
MDIKSFVEIQTNDVVRKRLAKVMVRDCFRNTKLEDYHAGTFPSSKTGDYTDVNVISPFGEIAWIKLSRLSDEEMKTLMIDVVNHCYKFLSELFLTGRGDDLINMLKERDLLPRWYDPGAGEPSTAGDG